MGIQGGAQFNPLPRTNESLGQQRNLQIQNDLSKMLGESQDSSGGGSALEGDKFSSDAFERSSSSANYGNAHAKSESPTNSSAEVGGGMDYVA